MADIAALGVVVDPTGAERGAKKVDSALNRIQRGAGTTVGSFSKLKRSIFSLQSALATVGVGFSFVNVISTTKDFSASISELSAITGAVGDDLDFLRNKAKEFGETTTKSASESAVAMKLVASAKPDLLANAEALAAVTKEALILSEAAGSTLPESAATLGASLNQFGVSADQAGRFINVLAAGAKFGASEIADTANALRFSGTVAADAGVSFEELNASIQVLSTVAIKGTQAGSNLRNILLKLQKDGDNTINPSIVGLATALENLGKKQLDVSKLTQLFGLENTTAAKALLNNIDLLRTMTVQVTGTATAYEQATVRFNNLSGDLLRLNSIWEALKITLGEKVELNTRSATQDLIEFVGMLNDVASNAATAEDAWMSFGTELQTGAVANSFDNITAATEQWGDVFTIIDTAIVDMEALYFAIAEVDSFLDGAFLNFPTNIKTGVIIGIGEFEKLRINAQKEFSLLFAEIDREFIKMEFDLREMGESMKSFLLGMDVSSELAKLTVEREKELSIIESAETAINRKANAEVNIIGNAIDLSLKERDIIISTTEQRLLELKALREKQKLIKSFAIDTSEFYIEPKATTKVGGVTTDKTIKELTEKQKSEYEKLRNNISVTTKRINAEMVRDATTRNEQMLTAESLFWRSKINKYEEGTEERKLLEEEFAEWLLARTEQMVDDLPYNRMVAEWQDTTTKMSQLSANWHESTVDAFIDAAATGKLEWRSLVAEMLKEYAKLTMMQATTGGGGGGLFGTLLSGIGGLFGGGGGGGTMGAQSVASVFEAAFANGGIMTSKGPLPLNSYAGGGVATQPQVSIFGDGSTNEAYVPLPDGRSIPVTMRGSAESTSVNITQIFNVDARLSEEEVREKFSDAALEGASKGYSKVLDDIRRRHTIQRQIETTSK